MDVAERLCGAAGVVASLPEAEVAIAAGRLCARLRVGLGRSIGPEGFRALFERAISQFQGDGQAVIGLGILRGDEVATLAGAAQVHGASAVATGMVALIATVIELLSRIVGEEMAVRLIENADVPHPRGVADPELFGAHDG